MEMEVKIISINNNIDEININNKKKKRKVTINERWKELHDSQYHYHYIDDKDTILPLIKNQIQQKINGYKGQDGKKNIYCAEKFIDYAFVIKLLQKSLLKCFYCYNNMMIVYDYVREPKQWTIERIDNSMGHNKDNVEVACLNCNLRRRTMYFERYLITKQLKINKLL